MGYLIVFAGGGIGAAFAMASISRRATARHRVSLCNVVENVSGWLIMGLIAGYFAFKGDAHSIGGCS